MPSRPVRLPSRHWVLPGGRLDQAHVDAARLAVDHVGAVHQLEHALAVERRAVMPPGLVDQIGRVQMGIDDHASAPCECAAVTATPRAEPVRT